MSETLDRVRTLVQAGDYIVSRHGFRELANDGIFGIELIAGIDIARLVEDYPDSRKEPSVLILQFDSRGPVHVMWGVPKAGRRPAILVTAYRPDPRRWSADFMQRRPR